MQKKLDITIYFTMDYKIFVSQKLNIFVVYLAWKCDKCCRGNTSFKYPMAQLKIFPIQVLQSFLLLSGLKTTYP